MKKKYRLRKWFKYLLCIITVALLVILISDATSIKTALIKTIICLPVFCINCYVLSVYGGLNE